jgi:hypothetical protein
MLDLLNGDKGPFQVLFGDDASADPNVVFPIVAVLVVVMFIVALRIILKSKGKSEMTEEELKADQGLFDGYMEKQAVIEGKEYRPEVARALDAMEIAKAAGEKID